MQASHNPNPIKTYLISYNLFLFLGWTAFFLLALSEAFQLAGNSILLLNIFQTLALLEILHAIKRWVSSPVITTTIQVFSRVFVLFLLNTIVPIDLISIGGLTGYFMVGIAWGITEMVRYSFYFFALLKKEIKPLLWLRYSLFYVLYPLGVLGEILIIWTHIKVNNFEMNVVNVSLFLIFLLYFVLFPKMFGHMLSQRRKKLAVASTLLGRHTCR